VDGGIVSREGLEIWAELPEPSLILVAVTDEHGGSAASGCRGAGGGRRDRALRPWPVAGAALAPNRGRHRRGLTPESRQEPPIPIFLGDILVLHIAQKVRDGTSILAVVFEPDRHQARASRRVGLDALSHELPVHVGAGSDFALHALLVALGADQKDEVRLLDLLLLPTLPTGGRRHFVLVEVALDAVVAELVGKPEHALLVLRRIPAVAQIDPRRVRHVYRLPD